MQRGDLTLKFAFLHRLCWVHLETWRPRTNFFLVLCLQEWQEKAQEAKKKYEEDMKAYKAKKANEPTEDSPEESKPNKKGTVKEFFGKKDSKKKSSPRKSAADSQKFKSAEFVETDDSSSEDEGKVRNDMCAL